MQHKLAEIIARLDRADDEFKGEIVKDQEAGAWLKEAEALVQMDIASFDAQARLISEFLLITAKILNTYSFDEETGLATFSIPAGITDVDALKVLNWYFRLSHPSFGRGVVDQRSLELLEDWPKWKPEWCHKRDYTQDRMVNIVGVVVGPHGAWRNFQEGILKKSSLVFAGPRDQVLAAAIHACVHDGADLLKGFWVRGSFWGVTLHTDSRFGIKFSKIDGEDDPRIAASGARYES